LDIGWDHQLQTIQSFCPSVAAALSPSSTIFVYPSMCPQYKIHNKGINDESDSQSGLCPRIGLVGVYLSGASGSLKKTKIKRR